MMSHCQRVKVKMHNEKVWMRFLVRFIRRAKLEEANALTQTALMCGDMAVGANDAAAAHASAALLYKQAAELWLNEGASSLFARYMFDTHGGTKHGKVSWPVFSNGYGLSEAEEPAGVKIVSEA